HPVHLLVAHIDAGAAADAVQLQTVANVDSGGADLHAEGAVDAITQTLGAMVNVLAPRPAVFAAACVVGNHQRIGIEHHALETGIGTHMQADLLAQPAGVDIGRS